MNTYSNAFMSRMTGDDTENAYANVFGTKVMGGIGDGGLDVSTGDSSVPFVQIKSSIKGLQTFLAESLRRKHFIPVCVGEPGAKEEMLRHLKVYGAWIGSDIQDRMRVSTAVCQVRNLCTA
jgi:hypothetical protein